MNPGSQTLFFSVVIPTYNRSGLLVKSIESVLAQSFRDFELLVCDDASTDDTPQVVSRFADPRLKYLRLGKNGGNAAARNLGARNAAGEYVAFLDSDDRYHPDFLGKMHALILERSKPGFLWCGVNRINEHGDIAPAMKPYPWKPEAASNAYRHFLKGIYFGTDCGFTVRRDCFSDTGFFDERLRVAVDTDFILRIVQKHNFAYSKEKWIDTFEHPGTRVRKNVSGKANSYELIFQKHRKEIEADPKLTSRWYYKLMWLHYHSGSKKDARRYFRYFMARFEWKAIALGMIFEIFPSGFAIRLHRMISQEKRSAN